MDLLTKAMNALKHCHSPAPSVFSWLSHTTGDQLPRSDATNTGLGASTSIRNQENDPIDMPTGQCVGENISNEVHFPQMTLVYVKLLKTNKHTSQFSFLIIKAETDTENSSCS